MERLAERQNDALVLKAREVFGIVDFRPGQRELLDAVMNGGDALGILPTSAGESLVYQLASLFLPRPVVVVTPLIALAEDQTDKLKARHVAATRLDSTRACGLVKRALRTRRSRVGSSRWSTSRLSACKTPLSWRFSVRMAARSSSSTKRIASPNGATTSGPPTPNSAAPPRRWAARLSLHSPGVGDPTRDNPGRCQETLVGRQEA